MTAPWPRAESTGQPILSYSPVRIASYRHFLLDFLAFLAAEGRIGKDDVVAVFVLDVAQVLGQCVGVNDVRSLDAVQDHVHDANDIGEAFLFLAIEGLLLQGLELAGGQLATVLATETPVAQIIVRLAQEPGRTAGTVVDTFADLRFDDLDHRPDQRSRRVVLASVATGIAHVADAGLVEMGQLVLFLLGAEAQGIDVFQRIAQRIT